MNINISLIFITRYKEKHFYSLLPFISNSKLGKKGKVGRAPPERRRGAHLPFKAILFTIN